VQNKSKKYAKEKGFPGWENHMEGLQTSAHLKGYLESLYPALMSDDFVWQSQSDAKNHNINKIFLLYTFF